jgi:aminomethyltransferase
MKTDKSRQSPLSSEYPDGTPTMPFGGWEMPRDFGGIIEEHEAVRSDAGLFDLSHMGRIVVEGQNASERIGELFTRDVTSADPGQALYGFVCDENGGCIDDVIAYVRSPDEIWMVVNAGNRSEVVEWFQSRLLDVQLTDRTADSVLLAIQGPEAPDWFERLSLPACPSTPFRADWDGNTMVASTGYTGEDGGEAWVSIEEGRRIFRSALEDGLTPCGLGARDTLRLEMGYPLHGHELSREIDPVTANLGVFIDWDHEFVGRESLREKQEHGTDRVVRGLELSTRRSPVDGASVRAGDRTVGEITSGRYSPTLETGIGMAVVDADCSMDEVVETKIRDDWFEAKQLKPPFLGKETS